MKKKISSKLTPKQKAELNKLEAMPYEQIDIKDIPEVKNWKK